MSNCKGSQRYIIDGGYKLVTLDGENWSLYSLEADDSEISDLSKQHPEKHAELLEKHAAWQKSLRR